MDYIVYIRVDDAGRVVDINSSAFLQDTEGWVEVDRGRSDRYHHAQGNYLPGPISGLDNIPIYKLDMGKIVKRTLEEMRADARGPEKTPLERLAKVEDAIKTITNIVNKLGVK